MFSEEPISPRSKYSSLPGFEPRRAFSLPSVTMPFNSHVNNAPLLPLTRHSFSDPFLRRSTARRLSYGIKNRASQYPYSVTIGGILTFVLFLFVYTRPVSDFGRFNSAASKLHIRTADEDLFPLPTPEQKIHRPDSKMDNGVMLLTVDENELIAEDDLFWDSYTEAEPLSAEEAAAEAELQTHKQNVQAQNEAQSLRALIWWLAEGGVFPNDFEVPSKSHLKKIGSSGFEKLLSSIDAGDENQMIFEEGWADFADRRYSIVVFSKTYCPYSKNAKSILGEYHLSPAPFIIELNQRSDMEALQDFLQRFTDRRTVPNILLDFVSIGGSDDITLLHSEGGLQRKFEGMGAFPGLVRREASLLSNSEESGKDREIEETRKELPVETKTETKGEVPEMDLYEKEQEEVYDIPAERVWRS
ncbi:glutaredoxin [Cryptococcus deuterogattii LA55]|nr:glutaredoxin [Cryptococcus deuterogattii LA55]KIR71266.1 glutaredoxin [Cryptococcus deuterogattii CA1014]KIR94554.1 glutaredoxin [Cryptococcus deuterogattii CBS 10090]